MISLREVAKAVTFSEGEIIHQYMHLETTIYMLIEGEASMSLRIEGKEFEGPTIESGRLFGGLGLVRDNNKAMRVVAAKPSTVLVVSLKSINDFRVKNSEDGLALFQDVINRIQQFNQYVTYYLEDNANEAARGFFRRSPYKEIFATKDEASYTMTKNFTCPICRGVTSSRVIRGTKVKMLSSGDFFMNYYEDIEPLWYGLVTCGTCGFTERQESFSTPIKYNKDEIKVSVEEIHHAHPITYSEPRNLEEVLNGYVMLEKTNEIRKVEDRVKARGHLVMFEIITRAGFEDKATSYRDKAFEFYKNMFSSGILDVNDLQLQQLYLILGKLHEKRGEYKDAKGAFRNAKVIKVFDDTRFNEIADDFLFDLEELMK